MASVSGPSSSKVTETPPQEPVKSPQDDTTSFPLAAQIPLRGFQLPAFPPEGTHLRELTLTADIKLDEYQSLLKSSSLESKDGEDGPAMPSILLPQSITHLTLELFSLGFPGASKFLSRLAKALPNLRSLTLFSSLIDGLDSESRQDAEIFFENLLLLRELHVIDSFARPGFFKDIGRIFESRTEEEGHGLKVVEVSYTYRGHEDGDFLARIHGEELAGLIVKGLVGASFNLAPAMPEELGEGIENPEGAEAKSKVAEGVLPFATDGRAAVGVRKRFENMSAKGELRSLRVLNLAMWTLRAHEVGEMLYACAGGGNAELVDLTVSVLLEDQWWQELLDSCGQKGVAAALEGLEIVGVPSTAKEEGEGGKQNNSLSQRQEDIEKLGAACPQLVRLGMSILKANSAGEVIWEKADGAWKRQ